MPVYSGWEGRGCPSWKPDGLERSYHLAVASGSAKKRRKKTEAPWLGAKSKYEAALVDRWKEREVSTGGQKLDGGLHRSLQDLQKRQPVGRQGLNRHDREGRGHQTGREDRSPGLWDGGAQLF